MLSRRNRRIRTCRLMLLESLECRRLLSVSVISKTATFTDVDGDVVMIAVTAGSLSSGLFTTATVGAGDQLQALDLTGASFEGTNLSITVRRAGGGDGLVNIGYINATGRNLGTVTVMGDVGQIDAGTGRPVLPAIKSLTVNSLGRLGLDSQGGSGSLASNINGNITTLAAKSDIQEAFILVNGSVGTMTLGGSLRGGAAASSGSIITTGAIKSVRITGDIVGGEGQNSGMIYATGNLTNAKIGGSVIGNSGDHSGFVSSQGQISLLAIEGSLLGNTGSNSAQIAAVGRIGSLTIGRSIWGGTGDNSGAVLAQADIGTLKIGLDLIGASINGSVTLSGSGYIESEGRIGSVSIGGLIIAGTNTGGGTLTQNASIRAANDIGSFTVKGSLVGNANNVVIISARGRATSVLSDLAIGSVNIVGRVEFANILAGYTTNLTATNGDAQIGIVKVGRDWIASNLVAGIENSASNNTSFGDVNDASIGAGKAAITASIASISIGGGNVYGTPASTNSADLFAFTAQRISTLKIAGISQPLTSAKNTLTLGGTGDVSLHEI